MSADEDINALAGEYVLGTLDAAERAAVVARLPREPALAAAVARWAAKLQPLADAAGEALPPAWLFDRVVATIGRAGNQNEVQGDVAWAAPANANDNVVGLKRSLRRWRLSAAGLGAIAAALAGWLFVQPALFPVSEEFVAVLSADGLDPAFLATVDMRDGRLTIRRVGGEPAPSNRAYELWAIEPNAAPRSLGLLQNAVYTAPIGGIATAGDLTLAITVEGPQGAPQGAPTGPVVFRGTLIPAD